MLVTMGMNGALAGPSSHFDLSGVFDLSDLELCEAYHIFKVYYWHLHCSGYRFWSSVSHPSSWNSTPTVATTSCRFTMDRPPRIIWLDDTVAARCLTMDTSTRRRTRSTSGSNRMHLIMEMALVWSTTLQNQVGMILPILLSNDHLYFM